MRALALGVAIGVPASAAAQSSLAGEPIRITRATGGFAIDGDLSDEGWRGATRIDKWYEVQPGDNVEPPVKNVGYLTYDDRFFYAGFEFEDPDPRAMRAPFADRDDIGNGFSDYGGILLDPRNTGRTGTFFVVTPRNIQYDSVFDDGSGEDSSPDFFWESATRITERGWTLEMRIPFSSLRYKTVDPQTWTILLYRNYPRTFHYQFFSAKQPRGDSCFVCHSNPLVGLEHLPAGGHLVAAPYVSAGESAHPRGDTGSPLVDDPVKTHVGLDVKWTPNADNAIDLTVKPDFSQVESDTAQISANERFALFFPEKRPFFLEGADLFQTPIQAVYTRTITSPRWGGRVTGKEAGVRYTVLVADDAGGGTAILPGPNESNFAPQDFGSTVLVGRAKRDIGLSSIGAMVVDREAKSGDHHNRVLGPDFQWRPSGSDAVTGQFLYSATRTPDRPELAAQWDGRYLAGHAGLLRYVHTGELLDVTALYRDLGSRFRADDGFVPQVGIRAGHGEAGLTTRPEQGALRRLRGFATYDRIVDPDFHLLSQEVTTGVSADGLLGSTGQIAYAYDQILVAGKLLPRNEVVYALSMTPGVIISRIDLTGSAGQQIDFDNARVGTGFDGTLSMKLRLASHLELTVNESLRWVDVDVSGQSRSRLFTARVDSLRATYSFTPRMFVRVTGQYEVTRRSPELYLMPVAAKDASFNGSALFGYKVDWQSVVFVGYGDNRAFVETTRNLDVTGRQVFVKLSHAFQW